MKTINTNELKDLLSQNQKEYVFIDVRTPEEWELGVIEDVLCISLPLLPLHIHEFSPADTFVFICRSGNRSGQACYFFESKGYKNVINYEDGMLGWEDANLPVIYPS